MKGKHHKKHYEDKRSAHLGNIKTLEANLVSKEQELQVGQRGSVEFSQTIRSSMSVCQPNCGLTGSDKCP